MRVVVESDVAPTTTRYLDRLGRTVRVEREALEAGRTIREDFAYDGLGRLAKATVPHFVRDGLGRPNADPPTAAYRYDARGRLVREARADGGATDHAYSARPEGGVEVAAAETILSPLGGRETRRRVDAYDAMGDHVLAVEAAGTAEETRTEYAYDGSGLLVSASVGGAAATKFEHDAAGNRVRVDDPHRGEARCEWTALGELRRRTDADGATAWAYDRLGRVVSRDGPDGAARWAYDAPNGAGCWRPAASTPPRPALCAWDERGETRECLAPMEFDWIETYHPTGTATGVYGGLGRLAKATVPHFVRDGPQ